MRTLLVALLGVSMAAALHIELSVQHIKDKLTHESDFLHKHANQRWGELGHGDSQIAIDFSTLKTSAPQNHDFKAVDYIFSGNVGESKFTAVSHVSLIASPPYGIYKNTLNQETEILSVSDDKLKTDLQNSLNHVASMLANWTHLNLFGVSDSFYALHFVGFALTQIAGKMHTNGKSVFMEYSSRDLHFSTKVSDPLDVYAKIPFKEERYLALTLSDTFLQDWINEFFDRRKEINVVELMSLFPEFDSIVKNAKAQHLQMLLPDIVDQFGGDSAISLMLNPHEAPEEHAEYTKKANKVQFNKDSLEIIIATYFDLILKDSDDQWKTIRQGYLGFGGKCTIAQTPSDSEYKFNIKPTNVGLKKLSLLDPTQENEDEREMEHESGAIFGLVNLMLKKQLKALSPAISYDNAAILNFFGLSRKANFSLVKGYLDIQFNAPESTESTDVKMDLVSIFEPVSEGFYKAQLKKKVSYEKKQKRLEYQQNQAKVEGKEDL